MEAKIYNQKGEDQGKLKLPESIFGLSWNADLVHQVMTSLASNKRASTASVKGRGEVRGGGRKPWKQKGTGRARHGSSRSPIWVGGGRTHGPSPEKNYYKKINKKMMAKALFTILSKKFKINNILFVDKISLPEAKTAKAAEIKIALSKISGFDKLARTGKGNYALIALPEKSDTVLKSFRNIQSVYIQDIRNINPLEVLSYKYLIMVDPAKCIKFLETKGK
ncbi:MAG TPA: 50S ribosomal protein L4 [Candidatus Paceibacterota bacterium]|uniref:Large ribosomal subunit protein uL4 n=1 Tax=uncultured Parcubacteria bacterium Rifle_16ft_4_minimus_2958 TaxID=1665137 RepID=A0A0H4T2I7_9BACT|nr:50S ribosomal protein L4, large subunit ribosomal protein L4 [uncultured Parcubacteria bacterium Rifle_16ft_4_minimus_2958]